jgi:hypothetical protein
VQHGQRGRLNEAVEPDIAEADVIAAADVINAGRGDPVEIRAGRGDAALEQVEGCEHTDRGQPSHASIIDESGTKISRKNTSTWPAG